MSAFTGTDAPDLDAIRKCVHCGICLPQCPTYRVLGEEMDSPRGRLYLMRAAAEGRVELTETLGRHFDRCLGCRACETACPSGVPFGSLLEATRAQIEQHGRSTHRGLFTTLLYRTFPNPVRLGALLKLLGLYQRSGLQRLVRATGLLRLVPRLALMDALLPAVPGGITLPALTRPQGPARDRVGLLTGCVQRHLYPSVNQDTVRLLALAGYEVVVPRGQGCCGALALHAGRLEEFRAQASSLAEIFGADIDFVVTNAAGCGSAMKEYGHLLRDDPAYAERAAAFSARVRDLSELLVELGPVAPRHPLPMKVAWHDACHLGHAQGIRAQPRAALRAVPGLQVREIAESEICCGSAGIYNLLEPAIAERLLEQKVDRVLETGASILATGNPGCLLQIAKGLRARGANVDVVHPVELLARAAQRVE